MSEAPKRSHPVQEQNRRPDGNPVLAKTGVLFSMLAARSFPNSETGRAIMIATECRTLGQTPSDLLTAVRHTPGILEDYTAKINQIHEVLRDKGRNAPEVTPEVIEAAVVADFSRAEELMPVDQQSLQDLNGQIRTGGKPEEHFRAAAEVLISTTQQKLNQKRTP